MHAYIHQCTDERHSRIYKPIFFLHLFCFYFFSFHLIGESHIYDSKKRLNHLNYYLRSSLKKNKKERKKTKNNCYRIVCTNYFTLYLLKICNKTVLFFSRSSKRISFVINNNKTNVKLIFIS